ncbi:MAG: family 43 glycosylhydrolase, partial [Clostridia bacterium]|nr:family 43 glycosylhydrolase [Clostridia bacterium]
MRDFKKITIFLLVIITVFCCGCSKRTNFSESPKSSGSSNAPIRYIQLQTIGQGKLTISTSYASAGEQVIFTAIPYPNYMVKSISVYDTFIDDINNSMAYGYTFTMQDKETLIVATFVEKTQSSNSSNFNENSSFSSAIISSSSQQKVNSSSENKVESSSEVSSSSISQSSFNSSYSTVSSSSSSSVSSSVSSIKPSNSSSTSSSSSSVEEDDPVIEETDNVLPTLKTIDTGISGIGDPYILADKNTNKYYVYATVNGSMSASGFKVWQSTDLKTWTDKGTCYQEVNSGSGKTPFDNEYWAPEVVYNPTIKKYIMYFSARVRATGVKKIGVAIGDSPLGPFRHDDGLGVMFDETLTTTAYIDAHFFLDDDGQAYLLYCNDCSKNSVNGVNTSQTWIRK